MLQFCYYLPRFRCKVASLEKNSTLQILWKRYSCYTFFLLQYVHSFHIFFFVAHISTVFQSCLCFSYFMKFYLIIPDWMISPSFVSFCNVYKMHSMMISALPLTYKDSINIMCVRYAYIQMLIICIEGSVEVSHALFYKITQPCTNKRKKAHN